MNWEITSVADAETSTRRSAGIVLDPILCFAAALAVFVVLLGHGPLQDWDEAIYGDIAREFVHGPSRLIPYWNFQPWLERTPLFEWVTAGFFAVFGTSEFWARAGAALAGAGTVTIVFLYARDAMGRTAAWLAAAILITTPQFFWQSRFGTTDSMLVLWMTLGLYGLYRVTLGRTSGWYLLWLGLGLGIMTKSAGPAPFVVTAVIVLFLHRRDLKFSRDFFIGLFLALAIVLPWHFYMWAHFGHRFLEDYIGRQILARSMKTLEGHRGTVFYYVIRIGKGGFPWSLLLLPVVTRALRARRFAVVEIYALVVFLFFTVVKTKLPWYISPFYPPMALIGTGEIVGWPRLRTAMRRFVPATVAAFASLAGLLLFLDVRHPYDRPELSLLHNGALRTLKGPLILCSDQFILDSPAPVFYANRPVVQAYVNRVPKAVENGTPFDPATNDPKFRDPQPLSAYVSSQPAPILLDRDLEKQVAAQYDFHSIASANDYVLGAISRHS